MTQTQSFIDALWPKGTIPKGCAVQLWRKSDKKTRFYPNTRAAAESAAAITADDVYIAAGLAKPPDMKPSLKRATNQTVVAIPGVWADIDVNGGPEGKTGAAPTPGDALVLATELLEATVILNSGYGIQAWWLFEEPWMFRGDTASAEREQAQRLVAAFQATLRASARKHGWGLDSTHDLARLLRVPGTFNQKGVEKGYEPAPVVVLEIDGPRHSVEAVSEASKGHLSQVFATTMMETGDSVELEPKGILAQPPMLKLDEIRDADPDFAVVWDRTPSMKTKGWSQSNYDLSLANYLVRMDWTDQEICDALVYHRLRKAPGDPKAMRADYYRATIGKARAGVEVEQHEAEVKFQREEATENLVQMASEPMPNRAKASSLFTTVLGGPEVIGLIQDGKDPASARYRLELADGAEIPLGSADALLSMQRFRAAFLVVTQHVIPNIKADKWHKIVQALVKSAQVVEAKEDTRGSRLVAWVREYAERAMSTDYNAAAEAGDPFVKDGYLYITLGSLLQWLRKSYGERIDHADLKQFVIAAGFERPDPFGYKKADGKRSSRSYWRAPESILEEGV